MCLCLAFAANANDTGNNRDGRSMKTLRGLLGILILTAYLAMPVSLYACPS